MKKMKIFHIEKNWVLICFPEDSVKNKEIKADIDTVQILGKADKTQKAIRTMSLNNGFNLNRRELCG